MVAVNKVFQIGPNRCGTYSIFEFFHINGYPAVHWDNGCLARSIYNNFLHNKPLLSDYEHIQVFTDMEGYYNSNIDLDQFTYGEQTRKAKSIIVIGERYFKQLDQQYPNSKFILNTRNIDNWIRSRLRHNRGYYATLHSRIRNVSQEILVKQWRQEFNAHHKNVLRYFRGRPKSLLVFDIERDNADKLIKFTGFNCKHPFFPHTHRSSMRFRSPPKRM